MNISDFTYNLPKESIAIHPHEIRGSSKLIVLDRTTNTITDSNYAHLNEWLAAGDVLILNNTKVLQARLILKTQEQKDIELIILEKHEKEYGHEFEGLYKGHIEPGMMLLGNNFTCEVREIIGNGIASFTASQPILDIAQSYGEVPIPPYLKREMEESDITRYQTVFAQQTGSVAAPTASLNMTPELMSKLEEKGVIIEYITLHVGLGTFLPIRTDNITEHTMHSEYFEIPHTTIKVIRNQKKAGKKIVALGTTVARTLEFCAQDILSNEPHSSGLRGDADIFIYPGYSFKIVDHLLTNFHAPKSTVLMLAGSFAGWEFMMQGYIHALENDYKFLSYGDSMLIL
jgi:S-adenosylmethionine:tRNA ribosyltransferase-isomerase